MAVLRPTFTDPLKEREFYDFLSTLLPYGITYLSHTIREPSGDATLFYSDMKWGSHFIEKKYYIRDAVMGHAFKTHTFVIPWDSVALNQDQHRIFQDREENFHKYNGLTISYRDGARHHLVGLATDSKTYDLSKFCLQTPQIMMDCLLFAKNTYK